jgi:3-isopropylmalate/(R)-2-methylmalate dehydratase small subunit
VAPSYARIFYRNAVDGGFLIPAKSMDSLIKEFQTGDGAELDFDKLQIRNQRTGKNFSIKPLGQVSEILEAGGIFAYARKVGMLGEKVYA